MNLELLDTMTIERGSHTDFAHGCSMEILNLAITGKHTDKEIPCLTAAQGIIIPLNDSGGWRNDDHRTEVMRPLLKKLAECKRDDATDLRITNRMADYAVREFALHCGTPKVEKWSQEWLSGEDRSAAEAAEAAWAARAAAEAAAARAAARAAAWAAAWAAWAAARDAAWDAAEAAAWAAAEAEAEAAESSGLERHTISLFAVIFEEYGIEVANEAT